MSGDWQGQQQHGFGDPLPQQPSYEQGNALPWSPQQAAGQSSAWIAPTPGPPPPYAYSQPQPQPPPTETTRVWSRKKSFALFAVLMLGAGGMLLAGFLLSNYPNVIAAAENVPAEAFIGDCFGNDGSQNRIPCDGDHHFEVFSLVEYDRDTEYPSDYIKSFGNHLCTEDFTTYTGDNYYSSNFDYQEVYPSEQDWAAGDRLVLCAIHHEGLQPVGKVFSP